MKFYRGKYYTPSRRNGWIVLACILLTLVVMGLGFFGFDKRSAVYQCPGEELPVFTVPGAPTSEVFPKNVEDLVTTAYEFTIETPDGTFSASCPVIKAGFAEEFNSFAVGELNQLTYYVQLATENGEPLPATKLSYAASYEDDILSVILLENLPRGDRSFVFMYDVAQDREVSAGEMSERYLGLSYTEFVCLIGQHIGAESQRDYSRYDPASMIDRYIYPTENGPNLLYELHVVDEESAKVMMHTVIESADVLNQYTVTPIESVHEILYNTEVSVMGADDQVHAELVRMAFSEHPDAFIAAATENLEPVVNRLLLYASQEEKETILDICIGLKEQDHWSTAEAAVIDSILTKANQ